MRESKKRKKGAAEQIANFLEIPQDVLFDIPRMILSGNSRLQIENYKSILSYEPTAIRIMSSRFVITVSGTKLEVMSISDDDIIIKGNISDLNFK